MFQPDTTLNMVLYNEWGGEAHGTVNASSMPDAPRPDEPRWWLVGLVASLLAFSYAAYRKVTAAKEP